MLKRCLIAAFMVSGFAFSQQTKVYERGVLVNIQEDSSSSLYQGTSTTYYYENYWVRVGDTVYKGWCRDRLFRGCKIGFTIGDPVEVRFEKSSMFLKLSNGKEQKATVEKRIRVDSQAEGALADANAVVPRALDQGSADLIPPTVQGQTGKVTITSVPADADIAVDGSLIGNSPATVKLAAGSHTVSVASNGYKSWKRELTILPDSELNLSATLEKGSLPQTLQDAIPIAHSSEPKSDSLPANPYANLPKQWIFPGGKQIVNISIVYGILSEHQEFIRRDGTKVREDCESKWDGKQWVGKCEVKLWLNGHGDTPDCAYELDEVVTSVSQDRIEGKSQESLPPKKGKGCPTPAKSMVKFVNIPKT